MLEVNQRVAATLASIALVGAGFIVSPSPQSAGATEDPEVSFGVMRYDSKNPSPLANQYTSSFNALEDTTWSDHGYWPFFAETDSNGALVELDENSIEIAEEENQYAAEAGVDYWAFLHAADYETDPAGGIYSAQFQRYLESSNRSAVKFAWILNFHTFTTTRALDEAIDYIISEQDDYFTVLDGRPLVYIYPNAVPDNSDLPTTIPKIRTRLQAAGLPNPYIVLFNRSGEGEDATSDYASRSDDDVVGASYDSYIDRVNREWSDPNEDADYADKSDARTGDYRLVHWKASDYSVRTEQTVSSISAGTYTLSVYVKSSGAIGTAKLTAEGCSGTDQSVTIAPATSTYQQVSITNVSVTNASCRIGVFSESNPAGEWLVVDDFSFTNNAAPSLNLAANPGFELGNNGANTVQSAQGWETSAPLDPGQEYIPNAPLNWDNRPFSLNPPPWGTGPNHWNLPPTAEQYRRMMQSAVNWVLDNQDVAPALTVVSKEWNGMEEGGNISPSLRYGARYLDALKAVNKSVITTTSPIDDVPQDLIHYQVFNHGGSAFKWHFQPFSSTHHTVQTGDYLEYDVKLLHPHAGAGSVELRATDDSYIFDSTSTDQNGLDAQAWEDLTAYADEEWYHRRIPLPSSATGKTIAYWLAASESQGSESADRTTEVVYDNVSITNGSGVRRVIFENSADGTIGLVDTSSGASGHLAYADDQGSRGTNLAQNPGFDLASGNLVQSPQDWATTGDAAADYAQLATNPGDARSTAYRGVHWSGSSYTVQTHQTITGLDDGRYSLRVWVRSSASPGDAYVYTSGCGGSVERATIPSSLTTWTEVRLPGIAVSGGSCTIGIASEDAPATQWIAFDDVDFREDSANLISNPGFEEGNFGASTVQSPQDWTTTSSGDADADFAVRSSASAHSGEYRGVHEKGSAYTVTTSQTVSGLSAGTYTLTAWTHAENFLGTARAVVTCGLSTKSVSVPLSRGYQLIRVENVPNAGTSCTVSLVSTGTASGLGFSFDDVAFYRQ